MTSTWTPLGLDSQSNMRTCFGRKFSAADAGAVTQVQPGEGVAVDNTNPSAPVITNTGVLTVGSGIGITVDGPAGYPIVNNAGVLELVAGTGIAVSGTAAEPVVANTGVLSVTAGTGVSLGGTAQNPVINASGTGVQTITAADTSVTVGGTATNPTVKTNAFSAWFSPQNTVSSTASYNLEGADLKVATIEVPIGDVVQERHQLSVQITVPEFIDNGFGVFVRDIYMYVVMNAGYNRTPAPNGYMCAVEGLLVPDDVPVTSWDAIYPVNSPFFNLPSCRIHYRLREDYSGSQCSSGRIWGAKVTVWPFSS
jgi:hypothetical protein